MTCDDFLAPTRQASPDFRGSPTSHNETSIREYHLKLCEDEMDAPVEIAVSCRNVDVSDHFRLHITHRLIRLERYDSNMIRYDVELDHENNPRQSKASQRVAILGHGKGGTVRAEARGPDFHAALDAAVAKLEARLRRNHDRGREHHDRHQPTAIAPTQAIPPTQA
jgi:ribosomal subunit interface protein